ncbi:MAG: hypothetical protein GWM98_15930, partial [Nitrospinaceae bacterium]|nr:hypothetical protein [Nitrospinaceae bacterium]NIR55695.1 hypothetical protein [Nitrospinaceae bacterium]NIS86139.1 hypothetical protein [Nitrospinaceae bacterium]NIT82983.1 hypothetical protein [Nitrospinaceae bacterium]NIU45186.1 hypothetical protein [Nitrospinaceae bacterium]
MNLNKIFDKLPYGTLIGWTPGHFMGLAAGVAILVIVGMYFLLIGPSRDEYAKLEGDLKKAEETLVLYRSEGALKEPMTKEVAALSGDLVFKKRQLPMADELPSLIQKIADIGEYLSVDILSFKLAPATK